MLLRSLLGLTVRGMSRRSVRLLTGGYLGELSRGTRNGTSLGVVRGSPAPLGGSGVRAVRLGVTIGFGFAVGFGVAVASSS